MDRLTQGEQIAGGSALALLIFMFLKWFGAGDTGIEGSLNGWESFDYISPVIAVTIAITLGLVAVRVQGRSTGDIQVGTAIMVLGAIAAVLILYRLLSTPDSLVGTDLGEASLKRGYGLYLGLLAALGIAAGGYLTREGVAVGPATARRETAPPPPPGAPGP